jgi:hypothetical protein
MEKVLRYDELFYEEHGWCSCYECDIIFTDLDELETHEKIHYDEQELPHSRSRN